MMHGHGRMLAFDSVSTTRMHAVQDITPVCSACVTGWGTRLWISPHVGPVPLCDDCFTRHEACDE